MACEFEQYLEAFHDGELDEATRAGFERHLPDCLGCTAGLERLRAMSGLLASSPGPGLSQISLHRLHNKVEQAMDEGFLRIVRGLSAIAACVLVAGSAWLVMTRENRTVETAMPVAPPWADVVASSDSPSGAYSTPAAAWYLADDSARSEDLP